MTLRQEPHAERAAQAATEQVFVDASGRRAAAVRWIGRTAMLALAASALLAAWALAAPLSPQIDEPSGPAWVAAAIAEPITRLPGADASGRAASEAPPDARRRLIPLHPDSIATPRASTLPPEPDDPPAILSPSAPARAAVSPAPDAPPSPPLAQPPASSPPPDPAAIDPQSAAALPPDPVPLELPADGSAVAAPDQPPDAPPSQ